jgi:SAM-dependent methyltransferase
MLSQMPLQTETLAACPVCQGSELHEVERVGDGYIPLLVLHRCSPCGLIFLSPRLTLPAVMAVENESTVYSMTPVEAEQTVSGPLTGLAAYLGSFARSGGRRWLDIGCNRGLLLEAVRRLGWQPVGVEIASEAAQHAREQYGLAVYASQAELDQEADFDMISAWHVLEHTTDPVGFLRAAAGKLALGGALAVQVPGYEFRQEYERRGQLSGLVCSVHNFYFTRDSLAGVLERGGAADAQHRGRPAGAVVDGHLQQPAGAACAANVEPAVGRPAAQVTPAPRLGQRCLSLARHVTDVTDAPPYVGHVCNVAALALARHARDVTNAWHVGHRPLRDGRAGPGHVYCATPSTSSTSQASS